MPIRFQFVCFISHLQCYAEMTKITPQKKLQPFTVGLVLMLLFRSFSFFKVFVFAVSNAKKRYLHLKKKLYIIYYSGLFHTLPGYLDVFFKQELSIYFRIWRQKTLHFFCRYESVSGNGSNSQTKRYRYFFCELTK